MGIDINIIKKGQDATYEDWRNEFYRYYDNCEISDKIQRINDEIKSMGRPDDLNEFGFAPFKEDIKKCVNIRIRLSEISRLLHNLKSNVKMIYDNMVFFLRTEPRISGKTKEDRKKNAELESLKEFFLLKSLENSCEKIEELKEVYKIKYEAVSRALSIVDYERKQISRES